MLFLYKRLLLIGLISCYGLVGAQVKIDSSSEDPALLQANQFFTSAIKDQTRLYNGREYNFYLGFEGVAYFQTRLFDEKAGLIFDDVKYENVPLILDLYKQKLITILQNPVVKLELATEKVTSFNLYGHYFINTEMVVENNKKEVVSGFFDQLYLKKSKILVKRTKTLQEKVGSQTLKKQFVDKNFYYLEKAGKIYQFNGEKKLLALFDDKKNEVRRYLKETNIKFKENPEEAIIKMITYYDKLMN